MLSPRSSVQFVSEAKTFSKWLQSYVRQSSFYPVSHNLESQYLQYVMEEGLWQLSCGGADKHSARPTSGTRRRRVPKQAMEFIH
jgi:hypothetical protein